MSGICEINNPQGLNQKCQALIAKAAQLAIVEKGTSFTASTINGKSQFVDAINKDLKMYIFKLTGYDNTTDDPEIQTTQFGQKFIANQSAPSMTAYGELNPCDFRNLLQNLNGSNHDVVFLNDDGAIMGWVNGDVFKGFGAKIWAVTKGVPDPSNLSQFYTIHIFFNDINEFKAFTVVKPDYNPLLELMSVMPNGLGLKGNSYNGTSASVYVSERCGDAVEGLVAADFEVVKTNAGATISSVTEDGDGIYTVAIALAAGETADIRVNKLVSSVTTDISWNLSLSN